MYPIIYQYKFITVGGYGVMLGIGFYLAFLLFERELKLRNIDPDLAYKILLVAIPAGIVGSKIFHILEHLDEFSMNPREMIFSGAGLSAYGGFLLAFLLAWFLVKRYKQNLFEIADAVTPSLALGYCFGRFGCHVAGDGCYGLDTASILGTAYPNGIVPTTAPVHPTPLYEVFVSFVIVGMLLQLRKREWSHGKLFFLYLILNGLPRFLVEFIRRNPKGLLNLTQAQWIGMLLVIIGFIGWFYKNRETAQA